MRKRRRVTFIIEFNASQATGFGPRTAFDIAKLLLSETFILALRDKIPYLWGKTTRIEKQINIGDESVAVEIETLKE